MKKILLSLITMFAVTAASAQEFSWGVKAGVNFSSVYGNDINVDGQTISSKADFIGGGFVEYKTCNWFGVGAEVLYSGQGYRVKNPMVDGQVNMSYINVPILANFHVTKFLALKTGVQPGFLLNARSKDIDIDKSECKTFDLSIPIGVEFQLNCGLLFDLRYNVGVTSVFNEIKAYNNAFALTVGWRF